MSALRSIVVALVACGVAVVGVGLLSQGAVATAPSVAPATTTLYTVSITEAGLPTGQSWSATLTNSTLATITNTSTSDEINFTVPNGSYSYAVANVTNATTLFVASPPNGSFAVSGEAVPLELYFVPYALPPSSSTYTLTFTETGLPAGTEWSVKVINATAPARWNNTTGTNVTFPVSNGAYSFTISAAGMCRTMYVAHPSSGNVTIDGANQSIAVSFSSSSASRTLYTITFTESGLPNGTTWKVELCGVRGGCTTRTSDGSAIVFEVTNGTYRFSIPGVGSSGNCSGWGSGGTWGAYGGCGGYGGGRQGGGWWGTAGGGPNGRGGGTTTTQYTPSPASGNVTVDGANATVSVVFTPSTTTTHSGGCGGGSPGTGRW